MDKISMHKFLPRVIEVVERAGELLTHESERSGGPRGSGDKAEVDIEIESFIRPALQGIFSCDWWGEETGQLLTGHDYCWVVDPNDGTSDFLKGIKGSSISVGLLRGGQPVLGIVHAPVRPEGTPDCISWAEGLSHLLRNGQAVHINLSRLTLKQNEVVLVSTAASTKPKINAELCYPATFHPMPSIAYRLARVAAGDALCGVSLYPVSAHDVVGGHALLIGAKGKLLDEKGIPLSYQRGMRQVSQRCFGGAADACNALWKRDWGRVFEPET